MATPTVYTPKPLANPQQLGTGIGTLYTVPAGAGAQITSIMLVNTSGTATAAGLYLAPSGSVAAAINQLVTNFSVPGDGLNYEIMPQGNQVYLGTNATIQGTAATASVITVHLSGVELA